MSIAEPLIAPTRVGRRSNGMSMTPEEFDATEEWDENYRYELVRGVLIVSPPPGSRERNPNDELGYLIRLYRDTHPNGSLISATMPEQTIKAGENRRRADRAVWIGFEQDLEESEADETTPTIVVEFTGSRARDRRRDYIEKRQEYAAIGVKEYWIIDRFQDRMTVIRGDDELVLHENDIYRTDLLPGFELPIGRILD